MEIKNKTLLKKVIMLKKKFYKNGWVEYDECLCGSFKLISPDFRISELKKDYTAMCEMIYGEALDFGNIFLKLQSLEHKTNR